MKVLLTYFERHGKFYCDGEYTTQKEHLYEIFDEVAQLSDQRQLPGLTEGHSPFIVLISVPTHPHNHLHLVMPNLTQLRSYERATRSSGQSTQ